MESSLQQTRKKKKSELTLIGLMIQISLYRLSCQALTQHSGIFMNEEVLNGIGIAVSSGSLRERPASDFGIKRVTYVSRDAYKLAYCC